MNTRTSSPSRWTWIRAPSSFHSTAAGRIRSKADGMSSADCASIGCSGVRSESRKPREGRRRLPSMAAAAAAPRSPRQHRGAPDLGERHVRRPARRRRPSRPRGRPGGSRPSGARGGTPARRPWPVRTGRGAPCGGPPGSRRRPVNRSGRARRRPRAAPTWPAPAPAEAGPSSDAHPTPIDPCGSTPER